LRHARTGKDIAHALPDLSELLGIARCFGFCRCKLALQLVVLDLTPS
jgi:hypothetical protein